MASFDIKSEIDHHEITNAVDQANRVLQNRFDFKGTGALFSLADNQVTLSAAEEFQIHQMLPILNESLAKRGVDLKSLKPGDFVITQTCYLELSPSPLCSCPQLVSQLDEGLTSILFECVNKPFHYYKV